MENHVLDLPNFGEVFQVYCDASGTTIRLMLSQETKPRKCLNDKMNEAKRKFPHMIKSLCYHFEEAMSFLASQRVYFVQIDHQDLKFINNQVNLNQNLMKWSEFLESYLFLLKHRSVIQYNFQCIE
jgi:hypothetical protein